MSKNCKISVSLSPNDLHFDQLASSWDEGIPLGNGMLGALIWRKGAKLRFSLDRADLWDLRPMEHLNIPEWKYRWVYEQWKNENYSAVQEKFDIPYDALPAPSKISGAALEFDISALGAIESVHLYLNEAVCVVKWKNGARLRTFVHATQALGWYEFSGIKDDVPCELIAPPYHLGQENQGDNVVGGQGLGRLGYPAGKMTQSQTASSSEQIGNPETKTVKNLHYEQEGWGGFRYEVGVCCQTSGGVHKGVWSICSHFPQTTIETNEAANAAQALQADDCGGFASHQKWWAQFWAKSRIQLPDALLQKQWYLEQYKFGSSARAGAPPISLQAVWTADNGKLPPWKGDFHCDLNTQLSYWPAYSANHLEEEYAFLDWLWQRRPVFEEYTQKFYDAQGLNAPGVMTLEGRPMGGWIQYSFGPTVSAWLAQHFYLHWRYSMDRKFLEQRAYPWIRDTAIYLEEIAVVDAAGQLQLPISASPETNDNSQAAWFGQTTNFDLALILWTYEKATELANELERQDDAARWQALLKRWPDLASDPETGLLIAPNVPYRESHRHFSHQLGFHPLALQKFCNPAEQILIQNTIATLDHIGSDYWTGYSFSWLANLKARTFDGEGAVQALRIFARHFCLPNSFHANGDQSGKGYSKLTYRPFTLEGNFAFAAGVQELLLQSHNGCIKIFPALPDDWADVSFEQLRAEGAFLVSAQKKQGKVTQLRIEAEQGGCIRLQNPFGCSGFACDTDWRIENDVITIEAQSGQIIELSAKEEE